MNELHKLLIFLSQMSIMNGLLFVVVIPTAVILVITIIVHRLQIIRRIFVYNEITGIKFTVIGGIYAVILGFATISAWDKFNQAEDAVIAEAGAPLIIMHAASGSDPESKAVRLAARNYLDLSIEKDWPSMEKGLVSSEVTDALNILYKSVEEYLKTNKTNSILQEEVFQQTKVIGQSRGLRRHLSRGIVPDAMWVGLLGGAIILLSFSLISLTPNIIAQIVVNSLLSIMIFLPLLIIIFFNYPFSGQVSVGKDVVASIKEKVDKYEFENQ
jgi:Protein of unknown function (DUF4239)